MLLISCGGPAPASEENGHAVTIFGRDSDAPDKEAAPEEEEGEPADTLDELDLNMDFADGSLAYFLALPEDSAQSSLTLAMQSLLLCSGYTAEKTAELLGEAGFEVLVQRNYDKEPQAADHTCAYTLARKTVLYHGEARTLLLAAIRGTNGGEWYSNFDPIPSRQADAVFSENFLFAAEDVFLTLHELAEAEDSPLFLLCGHSRGAACANLLGLLVNAYYGSANAFVYTFATPATVFSDAVEQADGLADENIFNYLNPCDLVPLMPPEGWGCSHAGTDIVLPLPDGMEEPYAEVMETLLSISPTAEAYYTERHSLTNAGLSEEGLTAHEVFLMVGRAMADASFVDEYADEKEETAETVDISGLIAEESDLYPLVELAEKAAANGWEKGIGILRQHLPNTYAALLTEMREQTEPEQWSLSANGGNEDGLY